MRERTRPLNTTVFPSRTGVCACLTAVLKVFVVIAVGEGVVNIVVIGGTSMAVTISSLLA